MAGGKKRKMGDPTGFDEAKPKRSLTIRERQSVIELADQGKKLTEIRELCPVQITLPTITAIMKKREYYTSLSDDSMLDLAPPRERRLSASGAIIDEHMKKWLDTMLSEGKLVTGMMLRLHAKQTAAELNLTDFKAASGWLDRFLARHNVKQGNDATSEVVRKPRRKRSKGGPDANSLLAVPRVPTAADVDRALKIINNYSTSCSNTDVADKLKTLKSAINKERKLLEKTHSLLDSENVENSPSSPSRLPVQVPENVSLVTNV